MVTCPTKLNVPCFCRSVDTMRPLSFYHQAELDDRFHLKLGYQQLVNGIYITHM